MRACLANRAETEEITTQTNESATTLSTASQTQQHAGGTVQYRDAAADHSEGSQSVISRRVHTYLMLNELLNAVTA